MLVHRKQTESTKRTQHGTTIDEAERGYFCMQGVHQQKQNMVFFGAAGIAGRPRLHAIMSRCSHLHTVDPTGYRPTHIRVGTLLTLHSADSTYY